MSKDTDIHSCGYFCHIPACIKAQRDELRQKLDAALDVVIDLGGEVRVPEMEEAKQRRKDAARYRWLRAQVSGHRMLGSAKPASFAFPTTMGLPPLSDIMRGSVAQHLDDAIDEQMRQRAAIDAARGQP